MTEPVGIDDFLYNFEAEHIFADSLWTREGIGAFLDANGYHKNALGNLMAEYADADTVAKVQALPDNNPFKQMLSDPDSGAGIVRHKGNASGGNQFGKNSFLEAEIRDIMDSTASPEAQRVALDNLFDWTLRLAKGEILGADGKPLEAETGRTLRRRKPGPKQRTAES